MTLQALRPLLLATGLCLTGATATAATFNFQQGVAGYSGAADTQVRASDADAAYGSEAEIGVDASDGGAPTQAFLRFNGLFGAGAGQIAPGSVISSATLTLNITSEGSGIRFHELLQPLNFATATWNNTGAGIQANGVEATTLPFLTIGANDGGGNITTGLLVLDVTDAVRRMQSGAGGALGWALLPFIPAGTNGIDFFSAEWTTLTERPLLSVVAQPVPEPGTWALLAGGLFLLHTVAKARRR